MNDKKIMITVLALIALASLYLGIRLLQNDREEAQPQRLGNDSGALVRPHSPVLGPAQAPVTIVEFFDPACEACRAFQPFVKNLMATYPNDVRLVLRYAPFHPGSEQIVRLLEASKRQDKYWAVLDAVLLAQPMWADHSKPNIDLAYKAAEQAGLDLQKAHAEGASPAMDAVLKQEMQDVVAFKIEKTPTFFVNGDPLTTFGPDQLSALVARKVAEAK